MGNRKERERKDGGANFKPNKASRCEEDTRCEVEGITYCWQCRAQICGVIVRAMRRACLCLSVKIESNP